MNGKHPREASAERLAPLEALLAGGANAVCRLLEAGSTGSTFWQQERLPRRATQTVLPPIYTSVEANSSALPPQLQSFVLRPSSAGPTSSTSSNAPPLSSAATHNTQVMATAPPRASPSGQTSGFELTLTPQKWRELELGQTPSQSSSSSDRVSNPGDEPVVACWACRRVRSLICC